MTIVDAPALPASLARGDWPEPHHLRLVAPDTPLLERATVTMNDGSRVQGTFVRLNPGARMLEFRPDLGPGLPADIDRFSGRRWAVPTEQGL